MKGSIKGWTAAVWRLFWLGSASFSCLLVSETCAQVIPLVDHNSQAYINVGNVGNSGGLTNWTIGGLSQLKQQWYWYRVGSTGSEQAINTIGIPTIATLNARTLYVTYDNGLFSVTINYLLTGSSFVYGGSDMAEGISITNETASPLEFHFFEYSDLNLSGTAGGDQVVLGKNLRGLFNEADQFKSYGRGGSMTETIVTPGANHGEAGLYPATLARLTDANTDNLNDEAGPLGGEPSQDATWAFQWDFNIPANSAVGITKDAYLIVGMPEPSSLAVMSLAVVACLLRKRRPRD